MSFFIISLETNIKRLLRPSSAIAFLVLALAMLIGSFVQKELFLQARVGVLYDDSSEISQEIIGNLEQFSNISIKKYTSFDKLMGDISAVKVECGYVFSEDIDKYMESGSINKAVKLYKSKATLADKFTNELIFAALLKTDAPYVSANYLTRRLGEEREEILNEAKRAAASYYESGVFMDMDVVTVGGSSGEQERSGNRINAGIISLFLFIVFFYIAISGIDEKKTGLYEKLSKNEALLYMLSFVLAHGILLYIAAAVLFAPVIGIGRAFIAVGAYVAFLSAICFLAAVLIRSTAGLYAVFPIVSISIIMLGGAFFDMGAISRLLPTYYFVIYTL